MWRHLHGCLLLAGLGMWIFWIAQAHGQSNPSETTPSDVDPGGEIHGILAAPVGVADHIVVQGGAGNRMRERHVISSARTARFARSACTRAAARSRTRISTTAATAT
jgi:hypothetical protein